MGSTVNVPASYIPDVLAQFEKATVTGEPWLTS
jgi:hypothetical protein